MIREMIRVITVFCLMLLTFSATVWAVKEFRGFSSPSSKALAGAASASVRVYKVTAYCPCEKCCGKWADGVTASGHVIQPGDKFIAAPPEIPFGTILYVPGYGTAPVLDRGGSIKGNRLDVFFNSHQMANKWGVRWLKVQ